MRRRQKKTEIRSIPVKMNYPKIKGKREKKEIREFQAETARQYEKNKKHYEQNYSIYQNAIRRLTEKLKICLEEQEERFPEKAAHGKLNHRKCGKQSIWTIQEYLREKKR